jgi:tRNA (guanine37-N1)-methyltransferase
MVMKPEPIFEAVEAIKSELSTAGVTDVPAILLSPQGRLFTQKVALELSKSTHIIFICGQYEGVDERITEHLATDEISIGDYVLTGGEIAAMAVVNAVVRLVPGFIGSPDSLVTESHAAGLLEYPQYTRPPEFRGWAVPEVLLSGNHAGIAKWRREQSLLRTLQRRPELLGKIKLSQQDEYVIKRYRATIATGVEEK